MKIKLSLLLTLASLLAAVPAVRGDDVLDITHTGNVFGKKPVPVALSGFSGEGLEVLRFDLYVQGFTFVAPAAAQYVIQGSDAGNVAGSVTDTVARRVILSRSYNGAGVRREAHAFADEIVQAITGQPGIAQWHNRIAKIAFKAQSPGGAGEIWLADFDGHGAQPITSDGAIVARPAWQGGRLALYYTSYARGNPDIFYHNLSTGQRRVLAGYSGLNTSAASAADGSRIAMVLSKAGSPNIWVGNADGTGLKRLTKGLEDSSPCWSPDGNWICFATKHNERRRLAKIPSGGGEIEYFNTAGTSSPSEPDWSPDGKWIAYTCQFGGEFDICVLPAAGGGPAVILVSGQNPSWAPNSRTLIFNRGPEGRQTLSVLDVFTKQYKDCGRAPGSCSQPAWTK